MISNYKYINSKISYFSKLIKNKIVIDKNLYCARSK